MRTILAWALALVLAIGPTAAPAPAAAPVSANGLYSPGDICSVDGAGAQDRHSAECCCWLLCGQVLAATAPAELARLGATCVDDAAYGSATPGWADTSAAVSNRARAPPL